MITQLNSKEPAGNIEKKWQSHLANLNIVTKQNRSNYKVIVIGTGLAGASVSASLAEMGFKILSFCFQDSPRRAHSIAAQGGINAAKNYQNDNDSTWRLFYDTIKGGDFRARESNVYRLAQLSCNIIDQAVSQGVPFAREYSGYLANRSFGGAQVSRTFYSRGQTGQQLLLGCYQAISQQIKSGNITHYSRCEMQDLILVDNIARGIVTRDLVNGKIQAFTADCVILCSGGYSNAYYLSTNAKGSNVSATWRAYKKGACFANPCFIQVHPTCIVPTSSMQSKITLMSESLRNDGRIWVPKNSHQNKKPNDIAPQDRDYFLERIYPAYSNLVPRDIASRTIKKICLEGKGIGPNIGGQKKGVYLDFSDAIKAQGKDIIEEKYGNLFELYKIITNDNPYNTPMKTYPAVHYTMGGLWVDYNLMTTITGLFSGGEANFSDHGANRLGASALMQGLADGYFILPNTISDYLARNTFKPISEDSKEVKQVVTNVENRIKKFLYAPNPKHSPDYFHQKVGDILWHSCSIIREKKSLSDAISKLKEIEEQYLQNIKISGSDLSLNQTLERAGRVADFIELGQLMCQDALMREESCGCHAREEYFGDSGEPKRVDDKFSFVSAWRYNEKQEPTLLKEPLIFNFVKPTVRNYK